MWQSQKKEKNGILRVMREDAEQSLEVSPETEILDSARDKSCMGPSGWKRMIVLCPGCFDPKEKQKQARWWKSDAERSESRSHGFQNFPTA
jgi:hypothetical protein